MPHRTVLFSDVWGRSRGWVHRLWFSPTFHACELSDDRGSARWPSSRYAGERIAYPHIPMVAMPQALAARGTRLTLPLEFSPAEHSQPRQEPVPSALAVLRPRRALRRRQASEGARAEKIQRYPSCTARRPVLLPWKAPLPARRIPCGGLLDRG